MATLKKNKRQKVDTILAGSQHTEFKNKTKRNGSSMAKELRDFVKDYNKKHRRRRKKGLVLTRS